MSHFVYIVECKDKTLYTGYCRDLKKRIKEHNGRGISVGAKYTHSRRPVKMRYSEELPSRGEALSREYEIKQLTREKKLALCLKAAQPPR